MGRILAITLTVVAIALAAPLVFLALHGPSNAPDAELCRQGEALAASNVDGEAARDVLCDPDKGRQIRAASR